MRSASRITPRVTLLMLSPKCGKLDPSLRRSFAALPHLKLQCAPPSVICAGNATATAAAAAAGAASAVAKQIRTDKPQVVLLHEPPRAGASAARRSQRRKRLNLPCSIRSAAPATPLIALPSPGWRPTPRGTSAASEDDEEEAAELAALAMADVVVAESLSAARAFASAGVQGAWAATTADEEQTVSPQHLVRMLQGARPQPRGESCR